MLISVLLVIGLVSKSTCHDRPVIGVLAQESPKTFESMYSTKFHSAIIASYVKWIEASGGLVIPLWIGKDKSYYQSIMSKINGVLLPGGSVDINYKGGYADASEHIMKHATELNLRQDFFPVFGIGVGMDLMLYLTNDKKDISSNCVLDSLSASVTLSKKDSKRSALYNSSTDHIKRLMTQHPIAVFSSKKCYIKEDFQESKLAKSWIPFSYNYDNAGKLVVSAVEHELMPFYGTLFHPEKVQFEWAENASIPHFLATIEVSQYLSNYFVNEARKSSHVFDKKKELLDLLIENFDPTFTGKDGSSYFQTYLFNKK